MGYGITVLYCVLQFKKVDADLFRIFARDIDQLVEGYDFDVRHGLRLLQKVGLQSVRQVTLSNEPASRCRKASPGKRNTGGENAKVTRMKSLDEWTKPWPPAEAT